MKRALAVLLVIACRANGGEENGGAADPVAIGPENTTVVLRRDIHAGPRISGSLMPERQAVLRAEVGGAVTGVRADIGQSVEAGEVMARIDDRALRDAFESATSTLRSARQELELARRNFRRTEELVRAGAVPAHDLETAESAVIAAESRRADARAHLASTQKDLRAAVINAPFDGVVSRRAVSEGDIVTAGNELFTVIDPSSMRLEASVPSGELAALEVGTPVLFEVRGYPEQELEGTIERVAPAADPTTRQIPIIVAIPNPGGVLVAGLFAEGYINAQSRETLVVPQSAIEEVGDNAYVTRVVDNSAERVAVTLGLREERTESVEITSGLAAGDLLLTGAARRLSPGTPVDLTLGSGAD